MVTEGDFADMTLSPRSNTHTHERTQTIYTLTHTCSYFVGSLISGEQRPHICRPEVVQEQAVGGELPIMQIKP